MKVVDCHAHFEPSLLNTKSLLERMDKHGIDQTFLMSAMTEPAIYNKSNFLMGIQRFILNSSFLWPLAKKLDEGFHSSPGEWDPWYRKFIGKKQKYRIIMNPNNVSVFDAVNEEPGRLKGWIFLNPKLKDWREEFNKWLSHEGVVGLKIHPFWHRYSIEEANQIAEKALEHDLPLMIHMGFDSEDKIKTFLRYYKDLKIIFSHAAFPFYKKIWPYILEMENGYVDLSSHHVDKKIIKRTVSYLGHERCLFGTDDPYGDELAGLNILDWINKLNLEDSHIEGILSKNVLTIIK